MVRRRTPVRKNGKVSSIQIAKTLQERRRKTAMKILASKASPTSKARARRILGL